MTLPDPAVRPCTDPARPCGDPAATLQAILSGSRGGGPTGQNAGNGDSARSATLQTLRGAR